VIGEPFRCEELAVADVLAGLGRYTVCANDPPWSSLAARVAPPVRAIAAWDMDLAHLESVAAIDDDGEVVVGLGGGTALDTAKFVAWRQGKPLVQIPSITSVDAGFTDAVGVRVDGHVRYVGRIVPRLVVLDLALVRSAPPHLNRAGIGDILSCHTGLWDWRAASDAGHGPPWRDDLAALGRNLLAELEAAAPSVAAVDDDGVRFLADAYRRIGAACAEAGHSRFEEGSEHFWAYAYEHATGAHPVHGEIIALATVALAAVQHHDPGWARSACVASGVRAHPDDLGVSEAEFTAALLGLRGYARANELDIGVADLRDLTAVDAARAWDEVRALPRVPR
jgi:glycerol dehydrogenase-like iron-containing ADH family enzyme